MRKKKRKRRGALQQHTGAFIRRTPFIRDTETVEALLSEFDRAASLIRAQSEQQKERLRCHASSQPKGFSTRHSKKLQHQTDSGSIRGWLARRAWPGSCSGVHSPLRNRGHACPLCKTHATRQPLARRPERPVARICASSNSISEGSARSPLATGHAVVTRRASASARICLKAGFGTTRLEVEHAECTSVRWPCPASQNGGTESSRCRGPFALTVLSCSH